jgi:hypothetical protein
MRILGHVLLWLGVLATSFVSVREATLIDWRWYGAAALVGLVGVVLLRVTAGASASETDKLNAGLEAMRVSLAAVRGQLSELAARPRDPVAYDVYGVKTVIDDQLAPHLATFADAREAMIPIFGIQGYADVMTHFAGGERLVNRAWSASADGYIDEVQVCVERAAGLFDVAYERFTALDAARASA